MALAAPTAVPYTSITNILSNASIATTDPSSGATVTTLVNWYGGSTNGQSPFSGAYPTTGNISCTQPPKGSYTFFVPAGIPYLEQYAIAVAGFQAGAAALGFGGALYPTSFQVSFALNPKSATYSVTITVLT